MIIIKRVANLLEFLDLIEDRQSHTHGEIYRSHYFLIKVERNWCCDYWRDLGSCPWDKMLELDGSLADMVVLPAFRCPHINLEWSFFKVLQEEIILIHFEWKLWLKITPAALGKFGMLSIMIIEIYSGEKKGRCGICKTSDRYYHRLEKIDLTQEKIEVVCSIGEVYSLLSKYINFTIVDNSLFAWNSFGNLI